MLFSTKMEDLAEICPKAGRFWATHDMEQLENGSYDLGDGECANVMSYDTKPRSEKDYEDHEIYADVQCVISGREYLEVSSARNLQITQTFNAKDDYALYSNQIKGERFLMEPGRFAIVFPGDAHMPGISVDDAETVKKVVFKIKASSL